MRQIHRYPPVRIEEVVARRAEGYSPPDEVARNPVLKRAIELLDSGYFTPDNIFDSKVVSDRLLGHGEHFMVLADFDEYMAAQARVDELFRNTEEWTRKSVINALSMGPFSSDRSIREYADNIWAIKPVL